MHFSFKKKNSLNKKHLQKQSVEPPPATTSFLTDEEFSTFHSYLMKKKERSKQTKAWLIYSFCFLLTMAGVLFNYTAISSFTPDETGKIVALPPSEKRVEAVSLKKKEPFTVLVLGTDKRKNDRGRTDTILVASVSEKSMQLLSIPRDTRVSIPGSEKMTKINHAYAYGGTELAVKTVESFLNIPIDYFINVNMEDFQELIDEAGGVTIENKLAFNMEGTVFPKKELSLNGEKALKYIRMRYDDPNGDFGRQERQQKVMYSLLGKEYKLHQMTSLFSSLQDKAETNITMSKFLYLQKSYRLARYFMTPLYVKGEGKKIGGTYYYVVSEQEQNRLSRLLRQHLAIQ